MAGENLPTLFCHSAKTIQFNIPVLIRFKPTSAFWVLVYGYTKNSAINECNGVSGCWLFGC